MDIQPVGETGTGQVNGAAAQPGASTPAPATPSTSALQAGGNPNAARTPDPSHTDRSLSSTVAHLVGGGTDVSPSVSVSYRVEKPDEIVTVFTDVKTGHEIAQVPSETMIQIAQFFGKETGVTLDRNV